MFTGVTLGVAAGTAAEADVPGLGPDAVCEEPAVAAPASSCWSEQPLADTWEEPSEAGASLSSLGEELLEEAGERGNDKGRGENRKSIELIHICSAANCYTNTASVCGMRECELTGNHTACGLLCVMKSVMSLITTCIIFTWWGCRSVRCWRRRPRWSWRTRSSGTPWGSRGRSCAVDGMTIGYNDPLLWVTGGRRVSTGPGIKM